MGGAGVGGSVERWTNKCSHPGGRPSKGILQVRYLAEVGQLGASCRLADGVLPSDLSWTPPVPPAPTPKKPHKTPVPAGPRRSSEGRRGKWGRPCSASTLRLRLEKSPRVKHDLHQGRKKINTTRVGSGGALPKGNVWQRRGSFPH